MIDGRSALKHGLIRLSAIVFLALGHVFSAAGVDSVRKVEFGARPEFKGLAEHARHIGNELYPKVCELLSDDKTSTPRQFDIVIEQTLSSDDVGALGCVRGHKGTVIYLNGGSLSYQPAALEGVLVHEMAHVAQRYSIWSPRCWTEGTADYVRFKLCPNGGQGDARETNCPVCSNRTWHYIQGYECAAAFLFFLEETCGTNVVRDLNARLRHPFYSDAFFKKTTGKTIARLWEDFKRTPRYTQSAAELTEALAESENVRGVRLKLGVDPFQQIRRQPGGELTVEAFNFLMTLMDKNKLPGFPRSESRERLVFPVAVIGKSEPGTFPVSRTFSDVTGVYSYTVGRNSRLAYWKLLRAWRTDGQGHVVEEYEIR